MAEPLLRAVAFCLLLWLPLAAHAIDPIVFASPEEERRFKQVVQELRCLQCQNESIAESNAFIAADLRRQVLEQMRAGKSDAEIYAFLVERYGSFVRYRPAASGGGWLLWLLPGVIGAAGLVAVLVQMRRRVKAADVRAMEQEADW